MFRDRVTDEVLFTDGDRVTVVHDLVYEVHARYAVLDARGVGVSAAALEHAQRSAAASASEPGGSSTGTPAGPSAAAAVVPAPAPAPAAAQQSASPSESIRRVISVVHAHGLREILLTYDEFAEELEWIQNRIEHELELADRARRSGARTSGGSSDGGGGGGGGGGGDDADDHEHAELELDQPPTDAERFVQAFTVLMRTELLPHFRRLRFFRGPSESRTPALLMLFHRASHAEPTIWCLCHAVRIAPAGTAAAAAAAGAAATAAGAACE